MRRRRTNVFGLAFLDAMTCGLGAVVLLFMVINASAGLRTGALTSNLEADADRLEEEVLEAHRDLVDRRSALDETEREIELTQGLSRRFLDTLKEIRVELATFEGSTLARREHLERLKADLRALEEEARRLAASVPDEELPDDETPGDRLRAFAGDGDRQYLTGLKLGGERVLVLLDASASMLDETLVNVIRRRNLPDARKVLSPKWGQAVATVDWLTTQLPRSSRFQVYTFHETVQPAVAGTAGQWLDAGDRGDLERAMEAVRRALPGGGTNLHLAFAAAAALSPGPDNLILVTDGLPTLGARPPRRGTVSGKRRLELFRQAVRELPHGVPVNVILLPMEGDPMAPSAFWKLAMTTRGSFLAPAEDWP